MNGRIYMKIKEKSKSYYILSYISAAVHCLAQEHNAKPAYQF